MPGRAPRPLQDRRGRDTRPAFHGSSRRELTSGTCWPSRPTRPSSSQKVSEETLAAITRRGYDYRGGGRYAPARKRKQTWPEQETKIPAQEETQTAAAYEGWTVQRRAIQPIGEPSLASPP